LQLLAVLSEARHVQDEGCHPGGSLESGEVRGYYGCSVGEPTRSKIARSVLGLCFGPADL